MQLKYFFEKQKTSIENYSHLRKHDNNKECAPKLLNSQLSACPHTFTMGTFHP